VAVEAGPDGQFTGLPAVPVRFPDQRGIFVVAAVGDELDDWEQNGNSEKSPEQVGFSVAGSHSGVSSLWMAKGLLSLPEEGTVANRPYIPRQFACNNFIIIDKLNSYPSSTESDDVYVFFLTLSKMLL
jgi:hypothetical protein